LIFGAATLGAVAVTHVAARVGSAPALEVTGASLGVVVLIAAATPVGRRERASSVPGGVARCDGGR
jgi:hypothetical protein